MRRRRPRVPGHLARPASTQSARRVAILFIGLHAAVKVARWRLRSPAFARRLHGSAVQSVRRRIRGSCGARALRIGPCLRSMRERSMHKLVVDRRGRGCPMCTGTDSESAFHPSARLAARGFRAARSSLAPRSEAARKQVREMKDPSLGSAKKG